MEDVKETGSNTLISNQGQLFPRAQSNRRWITPGTHVGKEVILKKFLRCGQKVLSDRKYSPAKNYGEKKRFEFKCFSTSSFFYMSILYRIS